MTCNMAIAFPTLACVMLCCGLMLTAVLHVNMIIKELISGLMSSIEKHTGPQRRWFLVVVVVVVSGSCRFYLYNSISAVSSGLFSLLGNSITHSCTSV